MLQLGLKFDFLQKDTTWKQHVHELAICRSCKTQSYNNLFVLPCSKQLGITYGRVLDWNFCLTWTELFNLGVGEMQRIVDPCQHVMSAEVVNGHRCGVDIHCHPLPKTNNKERDNRYSVGFLFVCWSVSWIYKNGMKRSGGQRAKRNLHATTKS